MAEERTDERDQAEEERDSAPAGEEPDSDGTEEERKAEASEGERKPEADARDDEPEGEERDLIGDTVVDPHGHKVGKIEAVFAHSDDERASWARVKMDFIGFRSAFIPLHDAQDEDGDVRIVYEREHVKAAPEIEPEGNELSDEEADQLHRHYGMERVVGLTAPGEDDDDIELSRETRDAKPPAMDEGALPKPPIPGIPEEEQPSPVKEEDSSEEDGDTSGEREETSTEDQTSGEREETSTEDETSGQRDETSTEDETSGQREKASAEGSEEG